MNALRSLVEDVQILFVIYIFAFLLFSLTLWIGAAAIIRRARLLDVTENSPPHHALEPGISIVSPAFNESASIMRSISSLLSLDYLERELVIVNDGSTDATLEVLSRELDLYRVLEKLDSGMETRRIKAIYRSRIYPEVRVIDKVKGGKSDALNAGINAAHHQLVCTLDADTILPREALLRLIRPFCEADHVVATGGMVRLLNGCEYANGEVLFERLPRSFLACCQAIEYLRSFIFGRIGWQSFGAVLIISGAFGLFRKDALISIGGYLSDTVGEDMELIIRMHRLYTERKQPYRIEFVPDAICWTEAPEDMRSLRNQRIRWQRGLGESLIKNRSFFFSRGGGVAGWLACPYYLIFELLGPLIELIGVSVLLMAHTAGIIDLTSVTAFFLLMLGSSLSMTSMAFLMDTSVLGADRNSPWKILALILFMLPESLFYRFVVNFWRTEGLFLWLIGRRALWGEIRRLPTLL